MVVDAGTATTVTAWRYSPETQWGCEFIGGLIAPGAAACLAGLGQRAPHLPALAGPAQPDADPLAADSSTAMANAVGIGYPGLVARLIERVAAAARIERVVATGGGIESCDFNPDVVHMPGLVLDGLAQVVGAQVQ